jgi:hypothetical protein
MLKREQGTLSKNRGAYDGNGRPAAAVDRKETAMAELFFIFLFLVFLL